VFLCMVLLLVILVAATLMVMVKGCGSVYAGHVDEPRSGGVNDFRIRDDGG
jgi:hypothetical protein